MVFLSRIVRHIPPRVYQRPASQKENFRRGDLRHEVLRRIRQQQMYIAQQKRITQIEAFIHEAEEKAKADLSERHARQAASRRKMLARMEVNGEIIERVRHNAVREELDKTAERGKQIGVMVGAVAGTLLAVRTALRIRRRFGD